MAAITALQAAYEQHALLASDASLDWLLKCCNVRAVPAAADCQEVARYVGADGPAISQEAQVGACAALFEMSKQPALMRHAIAVLSIFGSC